MDPTKNIDLILAIAARVLKLAPHSVFLVAGSGSYLDEYMARCRQSRLEQHVRFIGFFPNMYALLAEADIFLLPSFLELHSIAILEALRMKLPVVISQGVGCNDEFIQSGTNGLLCDPFQEEPWIDALAKLSNSPAVREAMGLKGYQTCRRLFNIEDTAARFENIYAELIA
jgi:glycosyltransferase involved in cell wall biosynthesis